MAHQTSGSITLDMDGMSAAVIASLEPVISQVNVNLERLAGMLASTTIDEDRAVEVLAANLPVNPDEIWTGSEIAGYLAEHLAQAGYALVAVAGPALEAESARNGFVGVSTGVAPVVDEATAQAVREAQWFADGRED